VYTVQITLHVAQTVNTEQLQHCIYRTNNITCSADWGWGVFWRQNCDALEKRKPLPL